MSDNLYTKKAWQLITLKRKTQLSLTGLYDLRHTLHFIPDKGL
jgi:hypothetical protein